MDQLELLQNLELAPDALPDEDDFGVCGDYDPMDFVFGKSPADFPGWVDGPLPEDPAEGPLLEKGYAARLGQYLDVVAVDHRRLAIDAARQARSVDAARLWSLVSDEFVLLNPKLSQSDRAEWADQVFVREIGALLGAPQPTASRLIDESQALVHELPGTLAALENGAISYQHARVIIDQARILPADVRAAFEQAVLPDALRLPASQLRRKAVALRERMHPDSIIARTRAAVAERRLAFEAAPDGMAWLHLFGPAADVQAAFTRVDAVARRRQGPTEPRTLTQLRADVAIELLHDGELFEPGEITAELQQLLDDASAGGGGSAGAGGADGAAGGAGGGAAGAKRTKRRSKARRGIRPTVIVTVPVFTLMGLSDEPATLDGYGPIDPDTARELCAKAPSFLRLMVNPETGVPLSLGREHYRVPKDLRIWLQTRDGTCRGVNCGQPAATSEIDHTRAFAHGGPTDAHNLAHLCKACHRLKHASTWNPIGRGNGVIDWTSPTGRVYTTWPALELPGTSLPNAGLPNTKPLEPTVSSTDQPDTTLPSSDFSSAESSKTAPPGPDHGASETLNSAPHRESEPPPF
ncbi:hypothetical protein GCM10022381_33630 [Leifsonia kafniensis]|uniref:HNH nuclease domain-containing protein n=1 Tax=Leifsonia kafniensis TaxID=475957 RepID=A0ABP7KWH3_9MICO